MGISERKEREKQEMRKNIIEAAMHMFVEEGYQSASIRKIADRIEYSPATIYLYYKDKDELLYDVQKECFDHLINTFRTEVTSEEPFTRLSQICKSYIDFGLNNPELYNLMFVLQAPMNAVEENTWKNGDDAFGFLVLTIQACMEKGLLRFTDPLTAGQSIWAMGHGLISLCLGCRMKVMDMTEEQARVSIYVAMNEFLQLIKT